MKLSYYSKQYGQETKTCICCYIKCGGLAWTSEGTGKRKRTNSKYRYQCWSLWWAAEERKTLWKSGNSILKARAGGGEERWKGRIEPRTLHAETDRGKTSTSTVIETKSHKAYCLTAKLIFSNWIPWARVGFVFVFFQKKCVWHKFFYSPCYIECCNL